MASLRDIREEMAKVEERLVKEVKVEMVKVEERLVDKLGMGTTPSESLTTIGNQQQSILASSGTF